MVSPTICRGCLLNVFRQTQREAQRQGHCASLAPKLAKRAYATKQPLSPALKPHEIDEFLSQPSWDVRSLLPTAEQVAADEEITPDRLRHLLRLSALPYPNSKEEESSMLSHLKSQLHFVKDVQDVDTTGVKPLLGLRDETAEAEQENEIGLSTLKDALDREELRGKFHRRIRRSHDVSQRPTSDEQWEVLGQAPKKVGRFFVVEDSS